MYIDPHFKYYKFKIDWHFYRKINAPLKEQDTLSTPKLIILEKGESLFKTSKKANLDFTVKSVSRIGNRHIKILDKIPFKDKKIIYYIP